MAITGSILTNVGASTALRTLQGTNTSLLSTQNRVSTGMKVANAKDNAAVWAISSGMKSETGALRTLSDSLGVAQSAVAAGRSAAELIVEKLEDVKSLKLQHAEATANGDTTSASTLASDISSIAGTITDIISNAEMNQMNFLESGGDADFNKDTAGSTHTVSAYDLSTASSITGASSLTDIETALTNTRAAAAGLARDQNRLSSYQDFANTMIDSLEEGVGSLVDADMTEESARLQALQVQQQLGVQALSIANQAPQALLGLFR